MHDDTPETAAVEEPAAKEETVAQEMPSETDAEMIDATPAE